MSLPAGMSSGRGRGFGKANPPRPGAEPAPRERKPLAPVSAKRLAELGEEPYSTFRPAEPGARPKMKQSKGKRQRPGGADAAGAWREAAFERVVAEHGRLVDEVTGENLAAFDAQVHHVLEAGDLWTRGEEHVAVAIWHPANAMVLHRRTHERHHNRCEPITRDKLRPATLELAATLDALAGDGWWAARIVTDYPEAR